MRRILRRIQLLWQWCVTGIPVDLLIGPGDEITFRAAQKDKSRREVFWIIGMITFFNVTFWFSDPWLLGPIPGAVEVFHDGRLALLIIAFTTWLLNSLFPRQVYLVGTAGGAAAIFCVAHMMGTLGNEGATWFPFIYPFLLVVVAEWMTPLERALVTLLYSVAALSGQIVASPDWILDPMIGVSLGYFTYIVSVSFLIGIYVDYNKVHLFHMQRELARARDHLEERVEEKTAALQAFVAHLDKIQDQERSRLAQDLHDELGQALTAQRLVLRIARRRYGEKCSDIGPNLQQLEELLDDVTAQFRALLRQQRQQVLEELGIEAALRHLSRGCEERLKLPCTLVIEPEPLRVGPQQAVALYRCMQEALTNAAKHANATRITLSVHATADEIVASVTDNGIGIPNQPSNGGFGLLGARERVNALSGTLDVRRQPAGGTKFEIRLPLQSSA